MKHITKPLSLVLVLLMLVSLFTLAPITANAIRSGDFEYEFLEDGTALLTDYFGDESVLKIPMEIDGHTVGGISYELLDKCRYVTSIESDPTNYHSVDGNLYDIFENRLIKYATGKTDTHFTVPSSVTEIGYRAFYYCYNLTSVTIPSGVNVIGQEAFSCCSYLTSITIPDSVISIGWAAFDNCKSLEKVYYSGSENDWHNINIQGGNDYLKKATIYYNATESTTPSETTEPTTEVTMDVEDTRNGLQTCLCSYSAIIDEVEYFGMYYENYYEFRQAYNEAMQIAYHDDDATAEELLTAWENLKNARNNLVKTDRNPYESIPESTETTEPTTEVTMDVEDARNGLQTCLCSYSAIIDEVEYFGMYYENYYEFKQAYNEAMQIAYHDDDATAEELLTARKNLENARNNLVKTDHNPYESIPESTETTKPTTEVTENTEPIETTKETEPTETVPQPTETEPTEVTMPAECAHVNTTTTGKKSATYFDKGNTGNKVCADCGELIETGKSVAKKVLKTPKVTIKGAKNSIKVTYKKVKDATGFLVTYKLGKKTYNKKFTLSKKELKKASVKKTISVKKSGTYKVSVRAFVTSGKKTAHSLPSTKLEKVK